jgi:two-component system response regulator HydG
MGDRGKVLAVDDDPQLRQLLSTFLKKEGYDALCVASAKAALEAIRALNGKREFDVILSDLRMAQMGGIELLKTLRQDVPQIPVIVITGFASVDTALESMRNGAFDYLVKPFKLNELSIALERALEKRHLTLENQQLRRAVNDKWELDAILGKSPGMRAVFDLIERVSRSTANVLVQGESGTGKEMVARAIHNLGPRSKKPFIAINCTAIPEALLESELFGHAKGSFTGASARKKGLIEEANEGTLFLDEIGDMSTALQAKLLRVLQERKIRPVGDTELIDVNVRVISATHRDLKAAIRSGQFREDLFYRLSVIPIELPPLRKRSEDIPLLAESFLRKYAAQNQYADNRYINGFSKSAIAKLLCAPWPGNVRELENVIERAVVLCTGTTIQDSDLPDADSMNAKDAFASTTEDFPTLNQVEERYMRLVLQKTKGRRDRAAEILGINRRTLYRKQREYGHFTEGSDSESDMTN